MLNLFLLFIAKNLAGILRHEFNSGETCYRRNRQPDHAHSIAG